jgi:hypothetical protein
MNLSLTQSWLTEPEEGFQPGVARIAWEDGLLVVSLDLTDREVMTTAIAHHQRLWEHGDVAELFIQKIGELSYDEYQLAPNGFTLALHYPDPAGVASVRSGERVIDDFFSESPFESKALKTESGWRAYFAVPLACSTGDSFRISCCRYDAARGRAPVISSTSPHPVRDFHRPDEWRLITPQETSQSLGTPS